MRNRLVWPIGLVLLGITLAVYCPVLTHSFLEYDDNVYVTANPLIQRGLTVDGWCWAWTTLYFENWHPLTWLSHMLDCQLFGLSPAGHHLTNLLFHLANTLLVFLVLRRDPDWPSWAYGRAVKVLHEDDPLYRNPAEALWRARQADAATAGRYPKIQALLAEAYAANGRMAEAAVVVRRALASTQVDADPGFVQGLHAALHRYEAASRQANAPATP